MLHWFLCWDLGLVTHEAIDLLFSTCRATPFMPLGCLQRHFCISTPKEPPRAVTSTLSPLGSQLPSYPPYPSYRFELMLSRLDRETPLFCWILVYVTSSSLSKKNTENKPTACCVPPAVVGPRSITPRRDDIATILQIDAILLSTDRTNERGGTSGRCPLKPRSFWRSGVRSLVGRWGIEHCRLVGAGKPLWLRSSTNIISGQY